MSGCKAFSQKEIEAVIKGFRGPYEIRDRALFLFGVRSGFRISELLSLRYSDVVQNGVMLDRVTVSRRHMKGKLSSREVVLHLEAKAALSDWIECLRAKGPLADDDYIFRSRKGGNRSISRQHYFKILQAVCQKAGVSGRIGTHSMRKSFASRVYDNLKHDLFLTQKALGHRNINSTVQYLSFRQDQVDEAILAA